MRSLVSSPTFQFILASSFGVFALLAPVPYEGNMMVPLGIISHIIRNQLSDVLPSFVVLLCLIAVLGPLYFYLFDREHRFTGEIAKLFRPSAGWYLIRLISFAMAAMVYTKVGPAWLWSDDIGGLVLNDLMVSAAVTIVIGCVILPFLTDFGLMEYMGTYAEIWFRRLFTIPGRGAVDAIASWLGGSSVGLLVTANQMRSGFYTQREAAVVATNFSIVSVAFALVIVDTIGLTQYFYLIYVTLAAGGIICAMIMPRIPPLSRKPDNYLSAPEPAEEVTLHNIHARAWRAALKRAEKSPGAGALAQGITKNILEIWIGVLPVTMFIAATGLSVAELTPLFYWLAHPFVQLLEWLSLEDGKTIVPALLISFADNLLPALLASDIQSETARFVIAVVSVGQLIFMSETGIVILKLGFPIHLGDLLLIFLLRTLILLPVAMLSAYIFL